MKKTRLAFLIALLTCATLCAAPADDLIYSRPAAEILGSTHVSGRYYFSDEDFLNEGAERLLEAGMGLFKGWLTPGFRTAYPYNSEWPENVGSLLELIQTPYYRELLDKPLHTYAFVVGEFSRPDWKNGLDAAEAAAVEAENHALAAYLLTRYKNTGKTFILQNWEGDNALRAWEIDDPAAYETARQGMVDWLNARQAGIVRARRAFGMEGVRVVGAVEMTRTPAGREPFDHPLVVDDVVPHTRADLYSLSTWGTRLPGDEKLLLAQLDYIRDKAPSSEIYGERNLMLGEFGAYELTYTQPGRNYPGNRAGAEPDVFNAASARGQLIANRRQLEYALQWGVQYAIYWELYCNGLRDGISPDKLPEDASGQRVADASHLKGVWMIRPDGSKTPTWYYFESLMENAYIADNLLDWSRVHARSPYLQKPDGAPFVGNQSARPASLVYRTRNLSFASVRILHQESGETGVQLYASADGEAWQALETVYHAGPELAGSGWRYADLVAAVPGMSPGSRFLKVELHPESAAVTRVNKVVAESAPVASDPNRLHYRFNELDGLLLNGQPVEGFDPEITRYKVAINTQEAPVLDCLPADPRIQTQIDSSRAEQGILAVVIGFPGEPERRYEVKWEAR